MDQTTKDLIRLAIDPTDAAARGRLLALDADNLVGEAAVKTRVDELVVELGTRYPGAHLRTRLELAQAQAAAERQAAARQ